jgi:hypothetical protein
MKVKVFVLLVFILLSYMLYAKSNNVDLYYNFSSKELDSLKDKHNKYKFYDTYWVYSDPSMNNTDGDIFNYKKQLIKYLRYRTEEENKYFINGSYNELFKIDQKLMLSDNFTQEEILDLSKLECQNIENKKFDIRNINFILCPIKKLKLDPKLINIINGINYVNFEKIIDYDKYLKNYLLHIQNICDSVSNNNATYKDISHLIISCEKVDIKNYLLDIDYIYNIDLDTQTFWYGNNLNVKIVISFIIFVKKDGKYIVDFINIDSYTDNEWCDFAICE